MTVANATACARRVYVVPGHGRLGNQLFQFAACYGLAARQGLCLRANPAVCKTFDLRNATDVACPGEPGPPGRAKQARLRPSSNWWGREDERATRRAIDAETAPRVDFQCLGTRQNWRAFADVALPFRNWSPRVAERAAFLWNATAPKADKIVALYHRVAANERQYQRCLPTDGFYAAARRRFETKIFPGKTVRYATSAYQFRGAEHVEAVLGPGVVTLDDEDPAVVLAALSNADAATFSWGSFSWWVAYFTGGPVLYDGFLRNASALDATGCADLLRAAPRDDVSRFADEHLPASWGAVAA